MYRHSGFRRVWVSAKPIRMSKQFYATFTTREHAAEWVQSTNSTVVSPLEKGHDCPTVLKSGCRGPAKKVVREKEQVEIQSYKRTRGGLTLRGRGRRATGKRGEVN